MKKKYWIIFIVLVAIIEIGIIIFSYNSDVDNTIPNDYIAVFKGETGETVHSTYLYKTKSGKKTKYKYINTTTTLNEYDSTDFNEEIIKKGNLKNRNEIFKVAKKNDANSYVKYIKKDKIYTIEEFMQVFN